jgi:hypothetical protein
MKYLTLLLVLFISKSELYSTFYKVLESENYAQIFGNDYQRAVNFIKVNKKYFDSQLNTSQADKVLLVSILFPERIRYSILSDYIETEVNEMLYTQFGSAYVDFSIGYFQMKPSFVENMEKYISQNRFNENILPYFHYSSKKETEIRKERVKRLKSFNWQLKYAEAFYLIINYKYNTENMSNEERIEFFASAYNSGFNKTKEQIIKNIDNEYFPYGTSYPAKQYSYSKVVSFFYTNNYKSIF